MNRNNHNFSKRLSSVRCTFSCSWLYSLLWFDICNAKSQWNVWYYSLFPSFLICMGVVCLHIVSGVKDLQPWWRNCQCCGWTKKDIDFYLSGGHTHYYEWLILAWFCSVWCPWKVLEFLVKKRVWTLNCTYHVMLQRWF